MDTIFMNSENSRTLEYHVLVRKLADKLDLRRGQKIVALSNLSIYYILRSPHGVMNLNYQIDHIQYQTFRIILRITLRNIVKMLIIHQSEYM